MNLSLNLLLMSAFASPPPALEAPAPPPRETPLDWPLDCGLGDAVGGTRLLMFMFKLL